MTFIKKLIRFPEPIHDRILEFQKDNSIEHFTTAVLELIRKGLDS